MSSISSEEVNYLIYRYFQEAGFVHSAFCFGQESFIEGGGGGSVSAATMKSIPPGELVLLLQKGLYYTNLEYHLKKEDGTITECERPFNLLEKHSCHPPIMSDGDEDDEAIDVGTQKITPLPPTFSFEMDTITPAAPAPQQQHQQQVDVKILQDPTDSDEVISTAFKSTTTTTTDGKSMLAFALSKGIAQIYLQDPGSSSFTLLHTLRHPSKSDLTCMCWSPDGSILSTGCQDGTFWNWGSNGVLVGAAAIAADSSSAAESQAKQQQQKQPKQPKQPKQHKGPVSKLAWSPDGTMLLSAASKPALSLWSYNACDSSFKEIKSITGGAVVDVGWSSDSKFFVVCTTSSKTVSVFSASAAGSAGVSSSSVTPVLELNSHTDDVNSVSFSPCSSTGSTYSILSSSDDCTSIIWSLVGGADGIGSANSINNNTNNNTNLTLKDSKTLKGHSKEVSSAKWSASATAVATASFDGSIRLWDALSGAVIFVGSVGGGDVKQHEQQQQPIYAIEPHPQIDSVVACGSLDGLLMVWDGGRLISSYRSPQHKGGIVDIAWCCDCSNNNNGQTVVAACTSDGGKFVITAKQQQQQQQQ